MPNEPIRPPEPNNPPTKPEINPPPNPQQPPPDLTDVPPPSIKA